MVALMKMVFIFMYNKRPLWSQVGSLLCQKIEILYLVISIQYLIVIHIH